MYAKTLSSLAGVYRRPGVLGPHWIRPTLRMRNDEPKRHETSVELSRFLWAGSACGKSPRLNGSDCSLAAVDERRNQYLDGRSAQCSVRHVHWPSRFAPMKRRCRRGGDVDV